LNALPCAAGASWDPKSICLPDTRSAPLEEIWEWIHSDAETTTRIFWLSGVTGAGKSAIAHTVAKRCEEAGLLASSFFFQRDTAERNNPNKLFSTIARGLANFDTEMAKRISLAIEHDQTVTTAPISRQFEKLVYEPSLRYFGSKPVVIVIDALDESCDNIKLLEILRDDIPKLPIAFRIFVTSRAEAEIVAFLSRDKHIRAGNVDIYAESNLTDIAIYAKDRLQYVARWKDLDPNWPGEPRTSEFIKKAGGLFIWVSIVSRYLCKTSNPDNKLETVLEGTVLNAEENMDELYSTVLSSCDWRDNDFVEGYGLFMGAVLAAKSPLSVSALQSLHGTSTTLRASEILGQLGAVLTGLTDKNQPIQIPHASLHDFLTIRALNSAKHTQFYLNEREHSERLALLSLVTLSRDLNRNIPGTGYLCGQMDGFEGIPEIPEGAIPEELWYACTFWMDHLVEIKAPTPELIEALWNFLSNSLVLWFEVITSKSRFHFKALEWLWVSILGHLYIEVAQLNVLTDDIARR
jgi:hypothetical protein